MPLNKDAPCAFGVSALAALLLPIAGHSGVNDLGGVDLAVRRAGCLNMTQLHGVHVGGVKVGSLSGGRFSSVRGFFGLRFLGGGGRFLRCGSGGGFSLGGRIVSGGLGGIGLRFDLVLRAPNMLVLSS